MFESSETFASIPHMQQAYTGRAGEYWVAAQILRRGFNVMPLSIDSGVDLLAHRMSVHGDNLVFQFQIKTTTNPIAQFTLTQEKFEGLWKDMVNLAVVFWSAESEPQAVIIPPRLIYMMTSGDSDRLNHLSVS